MLNYVIKRLFLMVPTFAAISLVIFVVLNFAPGTPGGTMATGEAGGQDASTAGEQRESFRIFKEQFNLDKPVLFNTRYDLGRPEIEEELAAIVNADGDVEPGRRIGPRTSRTGGATPSPVCSAYSPTPQPPPR